MARVLPTHQFKTRRLVRAISVSALLEQHNIHSDALKQKVWSFLPGSEDDRMVAHALAAIMQPSWANLDIERDLPTPVWSVKQVVLAAVQRTGCMLKWADEHLRDDKDVVVSALRRDFKYFDYASSRLKTDKDVTDIVFPKATDNLVERPSLRRLKHWYGEFPESVFGIREVILSAVRQEGLAIQEADECLRDDKEIVMAAISQNVNALNAASERLQQDDEIQQLVSQRALAILEANPTGFLNFPPKVWRNKDLVLIAVQSEGSRLRQAHPSLQDDLEIVLAAVSQDFCALDFASPRLKNDGEAFASAVREGCHTITSSGLPWPNMIPSGLWAAREFVLNAVRIDGTWLCKSVDALKDDPEIVSTAVAQNLKAFSHASTRMQWHDAVLAAAWPQALDAVQKEQASQHYRYNQNMNTFSKVPEGLWTSREFVKSAVQKNGLALQKAHKFQDDQDIVLHAIANNLKALDMASKTLQGADGIFKVATPLAMAVLAHSDEYNDPMTELPSAVWEVREVVLYSMASDLDVSLEDLPTRFRDDREVVLAAMSKNVCEIDHASARLKQDADVLEHAVHMTLAAMRKAEFREDCIGSVPNLLFGNEEVMLALLARDNTALQHAPESLRASLTFMLVAIKIHPAVSEYAVEALWDNRKFVLAAVAERGVALQFASRRWRSDLKVISVAVAKSRKAQKYALA